MHWPFKACHKCKTLWDKNQITQARATRDREIAEAVKLTLAKCATEGVFALQLEPECYPLRKFVSLLQSMIPNADIIARALLDKPAPPTGSKEE